MTDREEKDSLSAFIDMMYCEQREVQLEGLSGIRQLLSRTPDPPIQKVIEAGIVPKILELMSLEEEKDFQMECSWIITNICSGTTEEVRYILDLGVLDLIINLLDSNSLEIVDQGVWTLGNIIADCVEFRNLCLEKGCLDKFLDILDKTESGSVQNNTIWALTNVLRWNSKSPYPQVVKVIPVLKNLLSSLLYGDAESDVLWGLSYIVDHHSAQIIEEGFLPILVNYLKYESHRLWIPVVQVFLRIIPSLDLDKEQEWVSIMIKNLLDSIVIPALKKNPLSHAFQLLNKILLHNSPSVQLILEKHNYIDVLKAICEKGGDLYFKALTPVIHTVFLQASFQDIKKLFIPLRYLDSFKIALDGDDFEKKGSLLAVLKILTEGKDSKISEEFLSVFKQDKIFDKIRLMLKEPSLSTLAEQILAFEEKDIQENADQPK